MLLMSGCVTPCRCVAVDVRDGIWDTSVAIRVDNADTVTLHNAVIFLRCNERFSQDTLTLSVMTTTPDSLRCEENLRLVVPPQVTPAPLSGEVTVTYRERIRWDRLGVYTIQITPVRPVRGVEAVGINFVKSE